MKVKYGLLMLRSYELAPGSSGHAYSLSVRGKTDPETQHDDYAQVFLGEMST
jgi:hypothetical protein